MNNDFEFRKQTFNLKERDSEKTALNKVNKIERKVDALYLKLPHLKPLLEEIRKTALMILKDETCISLKEKTNTLRLLLNRVNVIHKVAENQLKEFNWLSFLRETPINMPDLAVHAEIALESLTKILIEAFKVNQSLRIICLTDLSIGILAPTHAPPFYPTLSRMLEPLKGKKQIYNLQIQGNKLTENDLGYLAEFLQKTPLKYLNISNNKFDPKSLACIKNILINSNVLEKPGSENILFFIEVLKKHRELIYLDLNTKQDPEINAYFRPNDIYAKVLIKRQNDPRADIHNDLEDFWCSIESAHWDEEKKDTIISDLINALMALEGFSSTCLITHHQYRSQLYLPFSMEVYWLIQLGLNETYVKRIIYLKDPEHFIGMVRHLYAPKGELFLSISPEAEKLLTTSPHLCFLTEKEAENYQEALSTLFPNFKNFNLKEPESFKIFFKTITYFINQEKSHHKLNFFGKNPIELNIWEKILGARYTLLKAGIIPLPEWERKNNEIEVHQMLKDSLDLEDTNIKLN